MTRLLAVSASTTEAAVLFGWSFGAQNGIIAGLVIGTAVAVLTSTDTSEIDWEQI